MAPRPNNSPNSQTAHRLSASLTSADENCSTSSSATLVTAVQAHNTRLRSPRPTSNSANRRHHAKSRTGCKTCKRRRIKCDEGRPSCRNCLKHTVTCDFVNDPPLVSSTPLQGTLGSQAQSQSSPRSQGGFNTPWNDINMIDLELMHNFTTFTCTTMASDSSVRQLLRTTAIYRAVDCPYLMRSILAVSALHMSHYRPAKKDLYVQRAMQHHQAATSAAIELMTDLKAEDCENLHIFSMLTVFYALGCPINVEDHDPPSKGSLVPHWLRLLHGMEPILHMLNPSEYRGVLTPLFDFGRYRMRHYLSTTAARDPNLLMDLQAMIRRKCTDVDLVPIYDDVIGQLRRILGLILAPSRSRTEAATRASAPNEGGRGPGSHDNRSPSAGLFGQEPDAEGLDPDATSLNLEAWDILTWQWTHGKDFLPLLEKPDAPQEAIAIFAHCLLVLKKLENQWWLRGWADHLMARTWEALDDEHRHWITWVTEEMGWIPPR